MQLDMPLWLWLLALLTALLASAITTITSIGAGLITYGVLGFAVDLKIMITVFAPAQLLAVLVRFWLFRKDVQWRLAIAFFIGVVPGIFLGTWLFHLLTELALRRILGVFLLGFAAYEYLRPSAIQATTPRLAWLPIGGVFAGAILGSIGVAGPLVAVIFLRYGLVKEALVAMISLFFVFGNTQRTLIYWHEGLLTADSLGLGLAMGLAMIGGVYAGRLILPRISRERFVHLVLAMLVLFGVKFLIF
ncbi:MAG: hypothetical protein ETSY2_23065 [Candidatus Entotheonella gemina]|uniref:Probable membrane transporter protein n=1 Tax=Candidatus Entotheonella gemina TaxID=1429439 RepID=W4M509_9BACT|nr:MAG: hypothetical protein ETSY2_23065 [Candidatus Entotheonella gemina]